MIVRVIDVETTGLPSETDKHAIVEIGFTDVKRVGDEWIVGFPQSRLVNPGRSIPPEASAVHHLRDADVAGAMLPEQACMMLAAENVDAFLAHNMEFEKQFFGGGGKPMLCSFKCSLRLFKDAPSHTAQTLRYFIGLDDLETFEPSLANPPHRAGPDSYVTAHIAALLLDATNFDDLVRWSNGPALLIKCWMNKHRGKTWEDVARTDPSYIDWLLNKSDISDRDIRATARYWQKKFASAGLDGEVL